MKSHVLVFSLWGPLSTTRTSLLLWTDRKTNSYLSTNYMVETDLSKKIYDLSTYIQYSYFASSQRSPPRPAERYVLNSRVLHLFVPEIWGVCTHKGNTKIKRTK